MEFGRVPGKGRIPTSIEKLSRQVLENGRVCVRTEKWQNPGEYWEKVESVRVSKNCPGEYRKRVESIGVPKNGGIPESTGKKVESLRVSKNCPGEYRKTIESM